MKPNLTFNNFSCRKLIKPQLLSLILVLLGSLTQAQISTTLNGFGNFISGSPGFANSGSYTTYNLGGWQPHHPACNQYNADGSLLVTHGGPVYRTSDGVQVGTFADNNSVHVKQWSNTDPNVMYYTTASNCTKNTLSNGTVTSTQLFDLASANAFFGISFSAFYGGGLEGSFVVGEDNAIAIFGIVGSTAHTLIWKIGTGWLPDHVTIPFPSGDFDLYCAAPIKDPTDANNLGYIFVKPVAGSDPNNGSVSWVIVKVTSTGATSKMNSSLVGAHHASMCVWQDASGGFKPGLIDIYGAVVQHDGGTFSIGSSWTGSMHVGWIRGSIYALGENSSNGANAMVLSKISQGGYQVLANGSSTGNTSYAGAYAKGGTTNVNYLNPGSQAVQMRKYTVSGDVVAPSKPGGLTSSAITTNSFTLSWAASSDNVAVTGYDVFRNGSLFGSTTSATSLSITGLTASTAYSMTVKAKDAAGNSSVLSDVLSVTTTGGSCSLPSGFTGVDIGGVSGQSSCESAGTYTIVAGGADIWNTSDQFRYTYKTLSGDGIIIAKVNSIQNTDPWAKSGVMIRESLAAGSAHVDCYITAANGFSFQWRAATNGTTTSTIATGFSAPYWVKLQRTGNSFSAYRSADGSSWTQVGTATTVTMASSVYIGLAATSHLAGTLGTSSISNLSITTGGDTQAPTTPTSLSSSAITSTSFTLSWAAASDNTAVTGYDVFRNGVLFGSTTTATNLSITGLSAATTYTMTVKAKDAAGNLSAASAPLSVTTTGLTNMLVNPGFESGTTAWTTWGTPTIVTSNQRSGTNCNQVATNWDGDCQAINSGFSVGNNFTYKAWFKFAAAGGSGGGNIIYQCFNGSSQVSIGTTPVPSSIGTTYTQFTVSFTVAPTTTQIRVSFENLSNQLMYVDDAELNNTSGSSVAVGLNSALDLTRNEPENGLKLTVTPNPMTDNARIFISSPVDDPLTVSIYDMNGKIVFRKQVAGRYNEIRLNSLPGKTMYILKVTNGKKLVKEKKIIQL
jgi:chitodextrinase